METTIDEVKIEIESSAENASSSLDNLALSIKNLQDILSPAVSKLQEFKNSLNDFVGGVSSFDTSSLETLQESLKDIISMGKPKNFASILNQLKEIPTITQSLGDEEIEAFTQKIKQLSDALEPLSAQIQVVGKAFAELPDNIGDITDQLGKINNKSITLTSVFKSVGIKILAVGKFFKSLVPRIKAAVEASADYIKSTNRLESVMGSMTEKAKDFINIFSDSLFLDSGEVQSYVAEFYSLADGFGIASDAAYTMSKNLTQLSYDMSESIKGLSVEDAMVKLKSGFAGELEPLRKIGIALDEATLQATATELGITKLVSSMTRAEKSELAYYQIMKSTTNMQGNFAKSLNSPSAALTIIEQQFKKLARAIGNVFIPILLKVLPYIIAFAELLEDLANWLAGKFGYDELDFKINTSSAESGIKKIGDSADETTKKLNKMLAPFDELNVIDFGDTSNTTDVLGGSLGIGTYDYDALKDLTTDLREKVDEIKEKVISVLNTIKEIAKVVVIIVGAVLFIKFIKFLETFSGNSSKIAGGAKSISTGFSAMLEEMGKATEIIALLGGIALVINSLTGLITAFSESDRSLGEILALLAGSIGLIVAAFEIMFITMSKIEPSWQSIVAAAVILAGFALVINQVSNLLETFSKTGLEVSDVVALMAAIFVPIVALMGAIALLGPSMTEGLIPFAAVIVGISAILIVMKETLPTILEACGKFIQDIGPFVIDLIKVINEGIEKLIDALGKALPPIIESVGDLFDKIFGGISNVISTVGGVIIGIMNTAKWLVIDVLNAITKFIDDLGPAINNFVDNAIQAVTKLINFMVSAIEYLINRVIVDAARTGIKALNLIPGVEIELPKYISIPRFTGYADGGFPETGEFFYANENGPELIGKIGNRAAVANNDQITEGIARASYEAFSQALRENSSDQNQPINVYVGNDKLYSGYTRYANGQSNMYGVATIKV